MRLMCGELGLPHATQRDGQARGPPLLHQSAREPATAPRELPSSLMTQKNSCRENHTYHQPLLVYMGQIYVARVNLSLYSFCLSRKSS